MSFQGVSHLAVGHWDYRIARLCLALREVWGSELKSLHWHGKCITHGAFPQTWPFGLEQVSFLVLEVSMVSKCPCDLPGIQHLSCPCNFLLEYPPPLPPHFSPSSSSSPPSLSTQLSSIFSPPPPPSQAPYQHTPQVDFRTRPNSVLQNKSGLTAPTPTLPVALCNPALFFLPSLLSPAAPLRHLKVFSISS